MATNTLTQNPNGTWSGTITSNDGSESVTLVNDSLTVVPYVAPPPAPSLVGSPLTIAAVFSDGTTATVNVQPGQRVPFVPANMIPYGSVMYHADGRGPCLENGYLGLTGDLTAAFTITAGTTQVFDGPLTIFAYRRRRPFWLVAPEPLANPDLSLFPYMQPDATASVAAAYAKADNSGFGMGLANLNTNSEGEHIDLGPLPGWDTPYLQNPNAANAAVVRGMADSAAPMMGCCIDPATQKMVDLSSNPHICDGVFGEAGNLIVKYTTACKYVRGWPDHCTNYNSLACALYGTDFDAEQLAFNTNWVAGLSTAWPYKLPNGCVGYGGAPRGIGRLWVLLLYAAKLSNNEPYFDAWAKAYLADVLSNAKTQVGIHMAQVGMYSISPSGAFEYPAAGTPPCHQYAPWQQHIFEYSPGLAVQCGYTDAQWLVDYYSDYAFSAIEGLHELATVYSTAGERGATTDEQSQIAAACTGAIHAAVAGGAKTVAPFLAACKSALSSGGYTQFAQNAGAAILGLEMVASATNGVVNSTLLQTKVTATIPVMPVPVDSWQQGLEVNATFSAPMAAALKCAEGSAALQTAIGSKMPPYKPGDYMGYPWANTGYAAMMRPGIAACVRFATDQTRAQAAWTKFMSYYRAASGKYSYLPAPPA